MIKVDISGLRGRRILTRLYRSLTEVEMVRKIWPTAIEMSQRTHDRILNYLRKWDKKYRDVERIDKLYVRDVRIVPMDDDTIILRVEDASEE